MPDKTPIKLYAAPISGHSHRARLMLSLLDLPFEEIPVDLKTREQKSPGFLALNIFGQIPVLDDNGVVISDSNAILIYLAMRYDETRRWLPTDAVAAAEIQRWLSAAAGLLAFGPAAARLNRLLGAPCTRSEVEQRAASLFTAMDQILGRQRFLAGEAVTIADIALYTYTAVADEGGLSLDPYPAIRPWLTRIEALPRFLAMRRTAA
ncbi:glutathione S-transferase [Niveibacterium sp. SC-1]|uniref:glutathione S-transferase family protein n=1 Tax=Niveibacterium sp. SC-1 TaxID=3135646 RepID=UPI00311F5719